MENRQLIATYGCIVNVQKEILLVQRADHDSHPGMWELPGGTVEHGEDPEKAVIREVQEETGLVVNMHYPITTANGFSSKGTHLHVVRIAFLCTLSSSNQTVQLSPEHSHYRWINIEETISGNLSDLLKKVLFHLKEWPQRLEFEISKSS